jgi:hypothetical protein
MQDECVMIKREFKSLEAKEKICSHGLRPKLPNFFKEKLNSLLERCWRNNPATRPSSEVLLSDLMKFSIGILFLYHRIFLFIKYPIRITLISLKTTQFPQNLTNS